MIINSLGSVAKVNLSVYIPLYNTSGKLVEDVLTRPVFLELYALKMSWRQRQEVLKASSEDVWLWRIY